jgi:hypothetical protein
VATHAKEYRLYKSNFKKSPNKQTAMHNRQQQVQGEERIWSPELYLTIIKMHSIQGKIVMQWYKMNLYKSDRNNPSAIDISRQSF